MTCDWVTEKEEQNWNGIRRAWSRKQLSNKHEKLGKKKSVLDKGSHCTHGRKFKTPFYSRQLQALDNQLSA